MSVILQFGGQTLIDPPEYFCPQCGIIYLWTGDPEKRPEWCNICLYPRHDRGTVEAFHGLVWDVANSEKLLALKDAWIKELPERLERAKRREAEMLAIAEKAYREERPDLFVTPEEEESRG